MPLLPPPEFAEVEYIRAVLLHDVCALVILAKTNPDEELVDRACIELATAHGEWIARTIFKVVQELGVEVVTEVHQATMEGRIQ